MTFSCIKIDGSYGSGGGQITRVAIALSAITKKPVQITNIRANRCNPGLRQQHMLGIKCVAELYNADVKGLEVGSKRVVFLPKEFGQAKIRVKIPTSGSISLLLQTFLPPALLAPRVVEIIFDGGGTAGKWCPTMSYFENVLVPNLEAMGVKKPEIKIEKAGYYPAGGARVKLRIFPNRPVPKDFAKDGKLGIKEVCCESEASNHLEGAKVSERQVKGFSKEMAKLWQEKIIEKTRYYNTLSVGSAVTGFAKTSAGSVLGSTSLGKKGKRAEIVGCGCAEALVNEMNAGALIDKYCADQLIIFMALAGGGRFKTSKITDHLKTSVWTCEKFLKTRFKIDEEEKTVSAHE